MNAVRLFVLTACLAPLLAQAASGSSYRVSLGSLHGTDPAAVAKQLAAQYHGHLETPVDEQGTFLMTLSSATADLLRRDPRVARLERQEVTASAAVAPNASMTWTLGDGNYQYDGSGNIKAIGSQAFAYDVENRLVSEGTTGTAATKQKYTYDGFGNILTYKDDDGITYTVGASAATNRASVTSSSAFHMSGTYDNTGNMTGRSDDTFRYDPLNVMTKSFVDGQWRAYVYNVNDERIGTILMTAETGGAETSSEWTIRDAGGQVLRRFAKEGGQYAWQQDYIYRDGKMLASEVTGQIATLHYHLDHLGSPRLITGNGGVQVSRHTYYPFGKEVAAQQAVREDKKFTGHERDPIGLDYMHARFYDYRMGRFLSVDPTWESADVNRPQSWNRYSYVLNDPVNLTDPDGRNPAVAWIGRQLLWMAFRHVSREGARTSAEAVAQASRGYILQRTGAIGPVVIPIQLDESDPYVIDDSRIIRLPDDQVTAPEERGEPAIGEDGFPIEIHHDGQNPQSPLVEMTRTDHRGKGNFGRNHSNTGQEPSKIDRRKWQQAVRDYWKREWDRGRFRDKDLKEQPPHR